MRRVPHWAPPSFGMRHVVIPLLPSPPLLQHHKVSDRDVTNMIMVMSPTAAVADEPGGLSRTKTDDKNKAGGARAGATSTISFDRYKTTMQVMMTMLPLSSTQTHLCPLPLRCVCQDILWVLMPPFPPSVSAELDDAPLQRGAAHLPGASTPPPILAMRRVPRPLRRRATCLHPRIA